ncbi:MAG: hypothetical protein AMXMBFR57_26060 [Acidimicrobiia bacterium]
MVDNAVRMSSDVRLAADTEAAIERRQITTWRSMSPAQKAATVSGLTSTAFDMARAGIRQRFPAAGPREQFLRLAILTLGTELALRAYPDAADLVE